MKKFGLILGLCAFLATPAFAEGDAHSDGAAAPAPAAEAMAKPAKKAMKGGKKAVKAKHGKKDKAAPAEAASEEAHH